MYLLLGLTTVTLFMRLQEISPSVLISWRHYCSGSCIVDCMAIVVTILQQTSGPVALIFLSSLPECSPSLRCRGCVVDVSTGAG